MNDSSMETSIESFKIYPNGVPLNCSFRVWIGINPYCTFGGVAAVTVTDGKVEYATMCNSRQCPLTSNE